MVEVTPGGISGALSLGAHCHTEVKIGNVWVNFHDGAEHTALRLMVLPVAKNHRHGSIRDIIFNKKKCNIW